MLKILLTVHILLLPLVSFTKEYTIVISNVTGKEIQIAVKYIDPTTKEWVSSYKQKGWITLKHWSEVVIGTTNNKCYTVYAKSIDGTQIWQAGNNRSDFGTGEQLPAFSYCWSDNEYDSDENRAATRITATGWDNPMVKRKLEIHFHNKCHKAIWVLLTYLDNNNNWKTDGWYKYEPGEKGFLTTTKNKTFYYYAQSGKDSDGNRSKWAGDDYFTFEGKRFGFKRKKFAEGDNTYTVGISCND